MDSSVHPEKCCTAACIPSKGQAARSTAEILALRTAELQPWGWTGTGTWPLHHGQVRYVDSYSYRRGKDSLKLFRDKFEVSLHQKEFKFIVIDFGFPPAEQDWNIQRFKDGFGYCSVKHLVS